MCTRPKSFIKSECSVSLGYQYILYIPQTIDNQLPSTKTYPQFGHTFTFHNWSPLHYLYSRSVQSPHCIHLYFQRGYKHMACWTKKKKKKRNLRIQENIFINSLIFQSSSQIGKMFSTIFHMSSIPASSLSEWMKTRLASIALLTHHPRLTATPSIVITLGTERACAE